MHNSPQSAVGPDGCFPVQPKPSLLLRYAERCLHGLGSYWATRALPCPHRCQESDGGGGACHAQWKSCPSAHVWYDTRNSKSDIGHGGFFLALVSEWQVAQVEMVRARILSSLPATKCPILVESVVPRTICRDPSLRVWPLHWIVAYQLRSCRGMCLPAKVSVLCIERNRCSITLSTSSSSLWGLFAQYLMISKPFSA